MGGSNPRSYKHIKFGENLSICYQDIEWNRTSGVNQGP